MKTLVFSLGLAAMMLSVTEMNAQSRGLFDRGEASADMEGRGGRGMINGGGTSGITNYGIGEWDGEEEPLGSGIAILVGAGLGYVALKKRKEDEQ